MKTQPTVPYDGQSSENTIELYLRNIDTPRNRFHNSIQNHRQSIQSTKMPQNSITDTPRNMSRTRLIPLSAIPHSTILRCSKLNQIQIRSETINPSTMPCTSPIISQKEPTVPPCRGQSFKNALKIDEETITNSMDNTPRNNQHCDLLVPLIAIPHSYNWQRSNNVKSLKNPIQVRVQSLQSRQPCCSSMVKSTKKQQSVPFSAQSCENTMPFNQNSAGNTPSIAFQESIHNHLTPLDEIPSTMPCTSPVIITSKQPTVPYHGQSFKNPFKIKSEPIKSVPSTVGKTPRNNQHCYLLVPLITIPHSSNWQCSDTVKTSKDDKNPVQIQVQSFHPRRPCSSPMAKSMKKQQSVLCYKQPNETFIDTTQNSTDYAPSLIAIQELMGNHLAPPRCAILQRSNEPLKKSLEIRTQNLHCPIMPNNSPKPIAMASSTRFP